jgi:phenylpyruvate tautomerase PptA (4-oxalocrotonate tautomerase family)
MVQNGSMRERVVVIMNDVPPDSYAIAGVTLKDEPPPK